MAPAPHDTSCPRCGASIAVPETGLNMVCAYCGHETPVPDVQQRREAMEREAAHLRDLEAREQQERHRLEREQKAQAEKERERQRHEHEQARRERRQRWGRRLASIPGCFIALTIIAVSLAAPAVGLYQAGVLDAFMGDPGTAAHAGARKALIAAGFTVASEPEMVRVFESSSEAPTVQLRDDLCYAIAVGSGELISSLRIEDPSGGTAASKDERAFAHALTLCPSASGVHQLHVSLDQAYGRYTWSWAWKAKGSTTPSNTGSIPRAPRSSRQGARKR